MLGDVAEKSVGAAGRGDAAHETAMSRDGSVELAVVGPATVNVHEPIVKTRGDEARARYWLTSWGVSSGVRPRLARLAWTME
jgi:hypothetical protein